MISIFQVKKQDKTSEKDFNEIEKSNISDEEFKLTVIKMFTELRRRPDEHSENINEKTENII